MSVNDARGGHSPIDAEARRTAYIGNVPGCMTSEAVAMHLQRQGYGLTQFVLLSSGTGLGRATQWGYVSFDTEEQATTFLEAGGRRPALFWPDGSYALIRPALGRGIIPGGGHQKAGGYAGQKASRRQFCG